MTNTNQLTSAFEEDWKQSTNSFDMNTDFDASFLNATDPFLDPSLFSDPSTPDSPFDFVSQDNDFTTPCKIEGTGLEPFGGLDCTVGTPMSSQSGVSSINPGQMDQTELDALMESFHNDQLYPCPSITSDVPTAPYFGDAANGNLALPSSAPPHQHSASLLQHPRYAHSPLRHQMSRRSVSEPPTGPRDGFDSGSTRHHIYHPPAGQMVFHRQGHYIGKPVPDAVVKAKGRARGRPLTKFQPYNREEGRGRSKRRRAPTSAPSPTLYGGFESSVSSPASEFTDEPGNSVMSITMSEERLRMMITEAVAKAVGALRDGGVVSSIETGEVDSETIVVGSRE